MSNTDLVSNNLLIVLYRLREYCSNRLAANDGMLNEQQIRFPTWSVADDDDVEITELDVFICPLVKLDSQSGQSYIHNTSNSHLLQKLTLLQ